MHHPDPVLTASLYSNRALDDVVADVVAPFWKRLAAEVPGHGWSLWMVRYNRCGDHLKLRFHGGGEHRDLAMRLLGEEAERHFAALPPAEEGAARASRKDAPPIDEDDRRDEDYPDRALRWTKYLRSYVNFGWKNHLDQDEYVARMAAAFSAGAQRVLDAVDAAGGRFPANRQTVLLKAIVAGLGALDLTAQERADYLAYHRDWLVRWKAYDAEREAAALALYDRRVDAMGAAAEQIGRSATRYWAEGPDAARADAWGTSLAELAAYLRPLRGDAAFEVDPFTDHPVFPPVFKAFHGLANTLGVSMLDEAFTHHLILRAADLAAAAAA